MKYEEGITYFDQRWSTEIWRFIIVSLWKKNISSSVNIIYIGKLHNIYEEKDNWWGGEYKKSIKQDFFSILYNYCQPILEFYLNLFKMILESNWKEFM